MSSKTLCYLIRTVVIAMAVCGIVTCGYFLPKIGLNISNQNPEYSAFFLPWLIFILVAAVPCFIILRFVWIMSTAVKNEQMLTLKMARWIKICAVLLLFDVGFFFIGNAVFLLLGMSHPIVFLVSLFVNTLGVLLAVVASVFSRYITKATVLQEEADCTI